MRLYKTISFSVVILLITVLFAGQVTVPAAAQTDTMQSHYNAQHTGDYSPVAGRNTSSGKLTWRYTTGLYVGGAPAVVNGVVYMGSDDHNVYALNATTGAKLWSFPTGGYVGSSPAVANGVVYVGSWDNSTYALNATTGAKVWNYTTGGSVYSSPAVANGVVYVGSQDHNLYALGTTPTTLTATASATNVAVNQKFTVSGTLKTTNAPVTPVTGQPAYLEASNDGATWFRISANKNTASTGAYSFTGYISQSGTYYLRAHFDGTTTYGASMSTPTTVTVS